MVKLLFGKDKVVEFYLIIFITVLPLSQTGGLYLVLHLGNYIVANRLDVVVSLLAPQNLNPKSRAVGPDCVELNRWNAK